MTSWGGHSRHIVTGVMKTSKRFLCFMQTNFPSSGATHLDREPFCCLCVVVELNVRDSLTKSPRLEVVVNETVARSIAPPNHQLKCKEVQLNSGLQTYPIVPQSAVHKLRHVGRVLLGNRRCMVYDLLCS